MFCVAITGCHLNVCADNILLQHVQFITNNDNSISISPDISIKLCGFGVSEVFPPNSRSFKCDKYGLNLNTSSYQSPQIINNDSYNAKAADMWALGIVIYQCLSGSVLYDAKDIMMRNKQQNGYSAVINGKLRQHLKLNNLSQYFSKQSFELVNNLLNANENNRLTAIGCMQNTDYFRTYYTRYADQLSQRVGVYTTRIRHQLSNAVGFPFYQRS